MIARLTGELVGRNPEQLVVDVGGVGYAVTVPTTTLERLPPLGGRVTLHIHTHMHDRGIELYGFHNEDDRAVFRLLLTVSSVGPRLAVAVLSAMDGPRLARAIRDEDLAALTKIVGVGKKTAQRLAMELRDSLASFLVVAGGEGQDDGGQDAESGGGGQEPVSGLVASVESALRNLGYKGRDVDLVLPAIRKEARTGSGFDQLLRSALKFLSPGG
ncbi:MAG: Holliday junction branch migration protein RuvA [Deltaproteobacteria bacterium]|nr:Holliday junction branch migration protein RuvA [Deltaproteobacteria bacterium]